MKRVVIRVSDNYSLDSAAAAILKLYGYLTFVESFRSFAIITFDCPDTPYCFFVKSYVAIVYPISYERVLLRGI